MDPAVHFTILIGILSFILFGYKQFNCLNQILEKIFNSWKIKQIFFNLYVLVGLGILTLLVYLGEDKNNPTPYIIKRTNERKRNMADFQWIILPVAMLVLAEYMKEIQKKNWKIVIAAASYNLVVMVQEIWNALIFYKTQYSAIWVVDKPSSFIEYIGQNVEILLTFFIGPLVILRMLPEKATEKICGMNNRIFYLLIFSLFATVVEMLLAKFGGLVWEYRFWSLDFPYTIWFLCYFASIGTFIMLYDAPTIKCQLVDFGVKFVVAIGSLIVFVSLGYI